MKGFFVTLEGPEGAGKTVIAKRLAEELTRRRHVVLSTREPGGTRLGERLRAILLEQATGDGAPIDARADALLFNAARAQLVGEVIRPALGRGEIVLCARYTDSTLAYQGYGAGLSIDELRSIATAATGGLSPDLTILLDVPPEIGIGRKTDASRNRFESSFDLAFHERVRAGFLAIAQSEPERFRVIDSSRRIDAVIPEVIAAVLAEL